jgi:hypothetical protein
MLENIKVQVFAEILFQAKNKPEQSDKDASL